MTTSFISPTKMGFKFLASPKRILVDGNNRVRGLEMEDNKLEPKGTDTAAVGLKQYYEFPCDAVVFAVGDKVDETVGLPYKNGLFVTNPNKTNNDPDDALFQAYDDTTGKAVDGVFLTGWARKASEGLVGVAKRDGEWCAEVVTRYLESKTSNQPASAQTVKEKLTALLKDRRPPGVTLAGLKALDTAEKTHSSADRLYRRIQIRHQPGNAQTNRAALALDRPMGRRFSHSHFSFSRNTS